MLGNFSWCFCRQLPFFKITFFKNNRSGTISECQTIWVRSVGPDLGPNSLQRLSADDKSTERVKKRNLTSCC